MTTIKFCGLRAGPELTTERPSRITPELVRFIDNIPLSILLIVAVTLGLAPFLPEPHVWEKLRLLAAGALTRPIDIFDLVMHGVPWLLVGAKLARMTWLRARRVRAGEDALNSSE